MYIVKILKTNDPQLDHLNVILDFETKEEAFKQADLFVEQDYIVQIWEEK
ncbi:hypothetical protein [Paenibacillus chitinolyticus]